MADFSDSKKFGQTTKGGVLTSSEHTMAYPVESNAVSNIFGRVEPIITPDRMISRYLKGIDLSDYSTEELKDLIEVAINDVENETDLNLSRVQFKERLPFDRNLYKSFVFFKTNNGPILSIEKVLIESSNGENIYKLPPDWIEMGFAHKRQINLIPILSIFGAAGLQDGQASNSGLIFIQAINNFQWLPAFFTVTYTCGVCHKDGHLPISINELVGITAAIEILGNKGVQKISTSSSISQDGISQSSSSPGPKKYADRIEKLEAKKRRILKKIKSQFHQKYFLSNL